MPHSSPHLAYELDLTFDARATRVRAQWRSLAPDGLPQAGAVDSLVQASGTPLLRCEDPDDGTAYVYSLFVPAEASRLFPCIDRPDAKARFTLRLRLPPGWTAVSCGEGSRADDGSIAFAPTPPLPTYAFGFAAGPFAVIEERSPGMPPMRAYVRGSQADRIAVDAREALRLSRIAIEWGSAYFGMPFPFTKHDLVLIPGFPFGGMEHAGATFLDEAAIAIGHAPGEGARRRRVQLVFHETLHQWLGDCVTMRAFDDLWLKEGFANLGAALCAEALEPASQPWLALHRLKQAAVRQDTSAGAVAVRQPVAQPDDAKALYGPAVYGKAPAVLRQARHLVGAERFDEAVRRLVRTHAYGNATLEDLGDCLTNADAPAMRAWLAEWLERPGAPTVRLSIDADGDRIASAHIAQHDASGAGRRWTQRLVAMAIDANGRTTTHDVLLEADTAPLPEWRGAPLPLIAFANGGDHGYGRFLLDARSRSAALERLGVVQDPLLRLQLVEALWEEVRDAALDPARFVAFALEQLSRESEWGVATALADHAGFACARYLDDIQAAKVRPALAEARARWGLARPAHHDPALARLLDLAGTADPDAKARCFARLLRDAALPDRWVEAAAERLNTPAHAALTLRFLRPALDALPALVAARRIFFADRWLAAFCGGHASDAALAIVRGYLREADLAPALRRKVLEQADELARCVRIRARHAGARR